MSKIIRAAERATKQQPPDSFTGTVYADEVVVGAKPSRMRATRVTFTPNARTHWHTHPVGQTLYCMTGTGRYQETGKPVVELLPGDTVVIPPAAKHWHGAAPGVLFCHLAMSEVSDTGEGTKWLEAVSEADYMKKPG